MQIPLKTAQDYLNAGLSVLPAKRQYKCPAIRSWKNYQERLPSENEVNAWFSNSHDAICIVTGKASGNLEILDFDNGGELFDAWSAIIEENAPGVLDRLVVENTPSGGWHVVYRCESEVDGNLKLAQGIRNEKLTTLIETRGHGGLFLCAPTPKYELVQGDFTQIPTITTNDREMLLNSARQLNEYWKEENAVQKTQSSSLPSVAPSKSTGLLPGDDFNQRGDVKALLEKHGWKFLYHKNDNDFYRRPGKTSGGHSATLKDNSFYVFSSNAHPFEPDQTYKPFAVFAHLECYSDFSDAASQLARLGYGTPLAQQDNSDVNLSGIIKQQAPQIIKSKSEGLIDPGILPERLLSIPGFINEVTEYTLQTAPYPNKTLAFTGALALMSFLLAQRIRDDSDSRSNVYMIALANSGAGKDHPRKVNMNIAYQIGLHNHLGDAFASGEGLEDAMAHNHFMLFQTDEIDGLIKAINGFSDARNESLMSILLKMYGSSSNIYMPRKKAGMTEAIPIANPSLTLYGSAVPKYYYEALNERMLSNGFFARLLIFEAEERGDGQEPNLKPVPETIIDTANYWANFQAKSARTNLGMLYPEPFVVPATPEAALLYKEVRLSGDALYKQSEKLGDTAGMAVWARAYEKVRKLGLIYAASVNCQSPLLTVDAVSWAWEVVKHQTLKMLFMARLHVAENPFHAMCLKMEQKLAESQDRSATRSEVMRFLKCKAAELDEIVESLLEQERIMKVEIMTKTKPAAGFKLII